MDPFQGRARTIPSTFCIIFPIFFLVVLLSGQLLPYPLLLSRSWIAPGGGGGEGGGGRGFNVVPSFMAGMHPFSSSESGIIELDRQIFVLVENDPEHRCVKGYTCNFTLASTLNSTIAAFDIELMVILAGPELVVADHHQVSVDSTRMPANMNKTWHVSFRAWTSGIYSVQIQSQCAALGMRDITYKGDSLYVEFPLKIYDDEEPPPPPPPHSRRSSPTDTREVGAGEGEAAVVDDVSNAPRLLSRRPPSVCDENVFGRWTRQYNGVYLWKCSDECVPENLRPENWIERVTARGIHEISFVGDSHLRVVYQHIRSLIEGHFDAEHIGFHGDLSHTLVGSNGAKLRMNFYWVDGIYQNNEFGCVNRGLYSGREHRFVSNISRTTDVMIVNSGAWTWANCVEGKKAYDAHLNEYAEWLGSVVGPNVTKVWRTETPFNGRDGGCIRRSNNGMAYANKMAREMATKQNMQFYDTWHIEAPRYLENCKRGDPHYSCWYIHLGVAKIWGAVGEAVAIDFMHFITYGLK